jgi:hypothetical protein
VNTQVESIKAVCPIYRETDRKRPELIGSGTLIDFGKARFIVTAAHVHDLAMNPWTGLHTLGLNLLPLPKAFVKVSLPGSGKRNDDHLDFAFARFDDAAADELAKRKFFLPFMLIDAEDRLTDTATYMFTGYPCSREKTDYGKKRIMPKMWALTETTVSELQMTELGYSSEEHIAVRYKPTDRTDESGKPKQFPSPEGMSGGAVWRGDGDPKNWLQTAGMRLVGIGIEHRKDKNNEMMIGVRMHRITALMAELNSDIRHLAPRRRGVEHEFKLGVVHDPVSAQRKLNSTIAVEQKRPNDRVR